MRGWGRQAVEKTWGVKLAPYQAAVIRDCAPDGRFFTISYSAARGSGKTYIGGLVAALAIANDEPGTTYIVGSGLRNAKFAFEECVSHLTRRFGDLNAESGWRLVLNSAQASITNLRSKHTGREVSRVVATASDPRRLHGQLSGLTIIDEPAQLPPLQGEQLWAAISTQFGKGSTAGRDRCLLIGTAPRSPHHWWQEHLQSDNPKNATHLYKGDLDCDDPYSWSNIRAANPGLSWGWPSKDRLAYERAEAKKHSASSMATNFEAYRLNAGSQPLMVGEPLLGAAIWREVRRRPVAEPRGDYLIGLDLGAARNLSSLVAFFPDGVGPDGSRSGFLWNLNAVGGIPDLLARGEADGVGDLYLKAQKEGSLIVHEGVRIPGVSGLLNRALERFGKPPRLIVMDTFRRNNALDEISVSHPELVERLLFLPAGQKQGAECVARFRALLMDGGPGGVKISTPPNRLLDEAIAVSKCRHSYAGDLILMSGHSAKKGMRSIKDDPAAAALFALGAAHLIDYEYVVETF